VKKFSFSFQYLLDAHKAREQAAEHALHTAIKEETLAKQELEKTIKFRAQQVAVLERMSGVVKRSDYAIYLRGIEAVQRELDGIQKLICQYAEKIEEQREALRQEMTRRKVLENLREREQEEWAQTVQSEAQKQMDELAVGRWSRQVRNV
jgi:flagellar export protein FliJ